MEDWIAIFKNDLSSKVFLKPGISDDILYWVKRFSNGKQYTPSSTYNTYALRDFEIFDSQLQPAEMFYKETYRWDCTGINEGGRDAYGSYCSCYIKDSIGTVLNINISGQVPTTGGYQIALEQHLYFPAIVFFLRFLSQYQSWTDVENYDNSITKGIGIPVKIFEKVNNRNNYFKDLNNLAEQKF